MHNARNVCTVMTYSFLDYIDCLNICSDELKIIIEEFDIDDLISDIENIFKIQISDRNLKFKLVKRENCPKTIKSDYR